MFIKDFESTFYSIKGKKMMEGSTMEQMIVIKQGTIHDAIHQEPYQGDILIAGGKIKKASFH